jgi:predicted metalloprotease with PDZ domain
MHERITPRILFFLALTLILSGMIAPQAQAADPVVYELRFDAPNTHLLAITVRAGGLNGQDAEFAMPAWSPGWYIINDYAKMVQEFSATATNGAALPWRKTDKQTWRVELGGNKEITVRYKLYANTLAVDWVQYNDRHAHIAGPAAWMYLVGGKERPARLSIAVPAGWRVATGMEQTGENQFAAENYDRFIDCPLEISDFAEKTFTAGGATFHVVVHDVLGRTDFTRFTQDLQKAVEKQIPVFAPVVGGPRKTPFAEYWFLFHIWPGTGGGLEHWNSTQIFFSSDWEAGRGGNFSGYEGKLSTASHEFFHNWNVKRLRPKPLGPFDYSREVPTPSLWISEGLTSYYSSLALVRAGLVKPETYLGRIAQLISGFERSPGRRERSIEDASRDTWFWYRSGGPAETNIANTNIDYYTGGQIMGHLLDLAIRQATNNQKSLDDWMRLLYQRYALPKPGFEPEDAVRAGSEVAGKDMSDFFRRYLSGKEVPPYEEYFAYAGIEVEKRMDTLRPWIGIATQRGDDGHAVVASLTPSGPAERAGLDRGDVVLAVEGHAVTAEEFPSAITAHHRGDTVQVSVMHAGQLRQIALTLASDPSPTYLLRLMENPTDLQKKIYRSWLGLTD